MTLAVLILIEEVKKSNATCVIPLAIMEKHGPHLPLGTDLFDVREIALRAAKSIAGRHLFYRLRAGDFSATNKWVLQK
jgi:creatinine amidohydrolase/Fe(II)-dependent formamide hydrolase-like protein